MQLNIFSKVAPLCKEKSYDYSSLIEFFNKYYKSKDYIYPSAVHRKLLIDIRDIYDFLEVCVSEQIVTQYFEIYCPICNRYTNNIYSEFSSIPNVVHCINCDENNNGEIVNPSKFAVIIYMVN